MFRRIAFLVATVVAIGLLFTPACDFFNRDRESPVGVSKPESSESGIQDSGEEREVQTVFIRPPVFNAVVSEAFYALSRRRNGTSSKVYFWGGTWLAMGDWPYPHNGDCCDALGKVTRYMYGKCTSCRGLLNTWNGFQRGGHCKFFVNLVLYRATYGYPGGHLVLPGGTYRYSASFPVKQAGPGWIIQSASMPHTAIVVKVMSGGLDVIDSNFVGGARNYLISRHEISWSDLDKYGYLAYMPHISCKLIP